jgi:ABC-type Na+ efflux pump permease subunit
MGGAGVLVAIFLGTSLVHKEMDRRTLFVVLTKPVSRQEFLLGKYVGLMGTLSLMMGIMGAGAIVLMLATGHWDVGVLGVLAATWMQLALVTSIAFCFSTITSGALAALYTVGFYMLGQQTLMVREFADSEAKLHLYNYVIGRALYYVLPNFGAFDFKNMVLYGHTMPWASWAFALAYGLALSLALLVAASLAWEGRELR